MLVIAISQGMVAIVVVIFAITGKEFFAGILRYHCVSTAVVATGVADGNLTTTAAAGGPSSRETLLRYLATVPGAVSGRCHQQLNPCSTEGYTCMQLSNPMHGFQSFDDFPSAVLVVIQCLTGEGFTAIMYQVWEATGSSACVPFFLGMGLIGTNLIFNMILAVIKDSISTQVTQDLAERNRRNLLVMHKNMMKQYSTTGVEMPGLDSESRPKQNSILTGVKSLPVALRKKLSRKWIRHVYPLISPLVDRCQDIARSAWWGRVNALVIFLNTVALCVPHASMSTADHTNLKGYFLVLNLLFAFDLAVKVVAHGIWRLFTRGGMWDLFDAVVVITSLADSIFISSGTGDGSGSKIVVLRMMPWLRVLRVIELGRVLDPLRAAMSALFASFEVVLQTFFLVSIVTVIVAALGGSIFICDETSLAQVTEVHSCYNQGFFTAVLSVFQVLTLEGWPVLMYDGMLLSKLSGWFYPIWVVLGAFILLSVIDSSVCLLLLSSSTFLSLPKGRWICLTRV